MELDTRIEKVVKLVSKNKIKLDKNGHSIIGGSGEKKRQKCVGSTWAEYPIPPEASSKAADEGTIQHDWLEGLAKELFEEPGLYECKNVEVYIQKRISCERFPDKDPDQVGSAREWLTPIFKQVVKFKPAALHLERTFTLEPKLNMYGTADCFFAKKIDDIARGFLYDYKNGSFVQVLCDTEVEIFGRVKKINWQLAYYAVAVQQELKRKGKKPLDVIHAYIIQPNMPHENEKGEETCVSKCQFTNTELDVLYDMIMQGTLDALEMLLEEREAELSAGEHCVECFCSAKPVCKAYDKYVGNIAGEDFEEIVEELVSSELTYSEGEISRLLAVKDLIISKLNSLEKYALNRLLNGEGLEGWKIIEGRANRKWIDNLEEVAAFLKKSGIPNPYKAPELITLGAAEKALGKNKGVISSVVTKPRGNPKLVQESHPSDAYDVTNIAAGDFE